MNIKRFSNFPQSIDPVKSQTILEQFLELNNNFGVLNENLQAIDANFEQVQEEFEILENEFAETQRKVNELESGIEPLSTQVAQNTSDIEELKQREDKQGTIVKVNGQAVSEWSPDTMSTDIAINRENIQQVTQAQASDSLAIVTLQSDNLTNKSNISSLITSVSSLDSDNTTNKSNISTLQTNVSSLQGDVTTLNQQQARSLKTPTTAPTETEIVGVDSTNSQVLIPLSQIGGGGGSENIVEFVPTSDANLASFIINTDQSKIKYVRVVNNPTVKYAKMTFNNGSFTMGAITESTLYIDDYKLVKEYVTTAVGTQFIFIGQSETCEIFGVKITAFSETFVNINCYYRSIPSLNTNTSQPIWRLYGNPVLTYNNVIIGYVE